MIQIPKNFLKRYNVVLEHNNIPRTQQNYYFKSLRYFLDFCQKYNSPPSEQGSLSAFMVKLKEKNQAEHLRKQAHHAVILYQTMKSGEIKKISDAAPDNHVLTHTKTPEPDKSHNRKNIQNQASCPTKHIPTVESVEPSVEVKAVQYRTDWAEVFNELKNSIKIRHYSPKTLKTYTGWVRRFKTFVASKEPATVSVEDVKAFLTWLAVEQKVSASSQNQAFNALLFLFRNVFGTEFGQVDGVVRAKRRPNIPVVLSRKEVDRIIELMTYPHKLIISLMYGCGLRISECLSLRVHNFNFDMKILTIHDGKGKKDRTVPIPDSLMTELKEHLDRVIALHERDCKNGFDGVFLYGQLEKKYKNAAKELVWQWFFPARNLTHVEKTNEQRRYHIHETSLQKALRKAVILAKIPKKVTSHTFRHSFASHLLQANYDIHTIQQLLGHSDVRTTMIYTHTVKSVSVKELKSPLDF